MSFTVKQFLPCPPPNAEYPSIDQHVYACSHYSYEYAGMLPCTDAERQAPDYDPKTGALITLYDEGGKQQRVIPLELGCHVFIENDRGKTIDHLIGDDWITLSQRRARNILLPPHSMAR